MAEVLLSLMVGLLAFIAGGMFAMRGIVIRMRLVISDFVARDILSREAGNVLMDVLEGRL